VIDIEPKYTNMNGAFILFFTSAIFFSCAVSTSLTWTY